MADTVGDHEGDASPAGKLQFFAIFSRENTATYCRAWLQTATTRSDSLTRNAQKKRLATRLRVTSHYIALQTVYSGLSNCRVHYSDWQRLSRNDGSGELTALSKSGFKGAASWTGRTGKGWQGQMGEELGGIIFPCHQLMQPPLQACSQQMNYTELKCTSVHEQSQRTEH